GVAPPDTVGDGVLPVGCGRGVTGAIGTDRGVSDGSDAVSGAWNEVLHCEHFSRLPRANAGSRSLAPHDGQGTRTSPDDVLTSAGDCLSHPSSAAANS